MSKDVLACLGWLRASATSPQYQCTRQSGGSVLASSLRSLMAPCRSFSSMRVRASRSRTSTVRVGIADSMPIKSAGSVLAAVARNPAAGSAGSTWGTAIPATTSAGAGAAGQVSVSVPKACRSGLNKVDTPGRGWPSSTASTSRSTPVSWSTISWADRNRLAGCGSVARSSSR